MLSRSVGSATALVQLQNDTHDIGSRHECLRATRLGGHRIRRGARSGGWHLFGLPFRDHHRHRPLDACLPAVGAARARVSGGVSAEADCGCRPGSHARTRGRCCIAAGDRVAVARRRGEVGRAAAGWCLSCPRRAAVPADAASGAGRGPTRRGTTAAGGARGRPVVAWRHAGACRVGEDGAARRGSSGRPGRRHAGRRVCRAVRVVLVADPAAGARPGGVRPAPAAADRAKAGLRRPATRQAGERRHPSGCRRRSDRARGWCHATPDGRGAGQRRTIRHPVERGSPERHRHRCGRAADPVAGASFGADRVGGGAEPDGRPRAHGGRRVADGGRVQPDLRRLRRAVRGAGRRFRHSVRRALPVRAPRHGRDSGRPRECRDQGRQRARPGRRGCYGRVLLVSAHRLQGCLGARADRRPGYGDRLRAHPDAAARLARRAAPTRRAGAVGVCVPGPGGFLPEPPPHLRRRSNARRSVGRVAAADLAAFRFRPDAPPGPERRGGSHLPRAEP